MNKIYNIDEELNRYGLTRDTYISLFTDSNKKLFGETDIDWSEIKDRYKLQCNPDTIRKGQTSSIFGGQFAYQFFIEESNKENNTTIEEEKLKYRGETCINKDGTYSSDKLIAISEDDLKNPSFLLKAHGFDIKSWELVSARNNIWNVYSKKDGIQELYSSKIVIKPRTNISLEEIEEFYKELITKYKSPAIKKINTVTDGLMLELPIFDVHLSKFASNDIVDEEYNSTKAKECFNYVIDYVINRVKELKIEKILFPVGNDFFHTDCVSSTTTAGTPQDTDMKHQTLFKDGVMLLIDAIDKLKQIAPVDVFCVQGNHDFMTSYHAVMSLWCKYYSDENVTVDISTSPRKYRQFGKSLIGYSHGDKEKKRINGIMQIEAREMWGNTIYHEWHLGHLHSEQTDEGNGVIIRNLSSITGTDAWHHNSGFVGSIRKCTCFIWDKENGLDTILNIVVK